MAVSATRAMIVLAIWIGFSTSAFAQTNPNSAMELFRARRWKEAAAAFAAAEKIQPGKTDALLYQGKALVNLGEFHAAAR